jgi:hypothetical protein
MHKTRVGLGAANQEDGLKRVLLLLARSGRIYRSEREIQEINNTLHANLSQCIHIAFYFMNGDVLPSPLIAPSITGERNRVAQLSTE